MASLKRLSILGISTLLRSRKAATRGRCVTRPAGHCGVAVDDDTRKEPMAWGHAVPPRW